MICPVELASDVSALQAVKVGDHAQRWRGTLVGCTVMVHQHLDATLSLLYGPHCLGRYDRRGWLHHAPTPASTAPFPCNPIPKTNPSMRPQP